MSVKIFALFSLLLIALFIVGCTEQQNATITSNASSNGANANTGVQTSTHVNTGVPNDQSGKITMNIRPPESVTVNKSMSNSSNVSG